MVEQPARQTLPRRHNLRDRGESSRSGILRMREWCSLSAWPAAAADVRLASTEPSRTRGNQPYRSRVHHLHECPAPLGHSGAAATAVRGRRPARARDFTRERQSASKIGASGRRPVSPPTSGVARSGRRHRRSAEIDEGNAIRARGTPGGLRSGNSCCRRSMIASPRSSSGASLPTVSATYRRGQYPTDAGDRGPPGLHVCTTRKASARA